MIYLILGEDRAAKERKIREIQSATLPSIGDSVLDFESFHALKLDPPVLKKALMTLPLSAPTRLVLVRGAEKLSAQNQDILSEVLNGGAAHVTLILESEEIPSKGDFFHQISAQARVFRFGGKTKPQNAFDMTRAIERHDAREALEILDGILNAGDPPLKIMGALVWFWGKSRPRLSVEGFKKGLLVLQEADLNIKRSRVVPEHAVEIAVTKLNELMNEKVRL